MLYEARRNAEQDQEEITWIERSILAADSQIGNMPYAVSLPLFAVRGCEPPGTCRHHRSQRTARTEG